ncbi:hypothetical protein Gyru_ORF92 [Gynaephora ruoergensis nucleopolyhedrovirus]|nr:hypothetical protein Gyru_ORF92 [Gynaephora ruoergensis nucleopolyhedrovirus]
MYTETPSLLRLSLNVVLSQIAQFDVLKLPCWLTVYLTKNLLNKLGRFSKKIANCSSCRVSYYNCYDKTVCADCLSKCQVCDMPSAIVKRFFIGIFDDGKFDDWWFVDTPLCEICQNDKSCFCCGCLMNEHHVIDAKIYIRSDDVFQKIQTYFCFDCVSQHYGKFCKECWENFDSNILEHDDDDCEEMPYDFGDCSNNRKITQDKNGTICLMSIENSVKFKKNFKHKKSQTMRLFRNSHYDLLVNKNEKRLNWNCLTIVYHCCDVFYLCDKCEVDFCESNERKIQEKKDNDDDDYYDDDDDDDNHN